MSDLNVLVTPFSPPTALTVSIPATQTTASVKLAIAPGAYVPQPNAQFLVYNAGFADAFIEFGNPNVIALVPNGGTPGSTPIPQGAYAVLTPKGNLNTYAAAICLTGQTTTIYITPGDGS